MDKRTILKNAPSGKFFITNIIGWSIVALINLIFQSIRTNFDFERALFGIFPMAWGFVFTTALRYYWGIRDVYSKKPNRIIIGIIPQSIITTILIVVTGIGTILLLRDYSTSPVTLMINNFLSLYPVILLWITIYFLFIYYIANREKELANLRLINSLQAARLDSLRAQLNPHFLFNTLNNIRSLIREDGERARDMISSLTDILRYSLTSRNEQKVTLKNEAGFLTEYLKLESLHMEERLKYEINISAECERALVPPMIVQLVAENAIKHGLSKLKEGGVINISVSREESNLKIKVSNTGTLAVEKGNAEGGVGIANIKDRLSILYGKDASFSLYQEGNLVNALITLPFEGEL